MRLRLLLLLLLWPTLAQSADLNGYTAQYECRAGGPQCNVDVVGLTTISTNPCQQTITTADSPSTINTKVNGGSQFICITPGNYTSKGVITLTVSGTSGAYKVLEYTRTSDTNDDPWNQTSGNQVQLQGINTNGKAYWIIHRLTFPHVTYASAGPPRLEVVDPSNNLIISRIDVEGMQSGNSYGYYGISIEFLYSVPCHDITVQNSVIRNSWGIAGQEPMGVSADYGTNLHFVNNEAYDWAAHAMQIGQNNSPTISWVIENNDLYETSAVWVTSGGNNYSRTKVPMSIKSSGTSTSNYNQLIHNRVWGVRQSTTALDNIDADGPDCWYFVTNSVSTTVYTLEQNNICTDSQLGTAAYNGPAHHISYIGNIFYNIQPGVTGNPGIAVDDGGNIDTSEYYLNTIINSQYAISNSNNATEDWRCNVILSSGGNYNTGSITDGADQADYNVFYDSTAFTYHGVPSNISNAIVTRANTTAYTVGQIIRTGVITGCSVGTESACFLYKATVAGTSAGSPPTACTTLGCAYTDGGVTWKAVRGPYVFWRKLRTAPEKYAVPYAELDVTAPEYHYCTVGNMGTHLGSRTGIGIDDTVAPW